MPKRSSSTHSTFPRKRATQPEAVKRHSRGVRSVDCEEAAGITCCLFLTSCKRAALLPAIMFNLNTLFGGGVNNIDNKIIVDCRTLTTNCRYGESITCIQYKLHISALARP
jgi:hypothetical protein